MTRLIISNLQFEADRRSIIITINSFDTELTKDDREKLYPRCGKLYPEGLVALARADDYEQVRVFFFFLNLFEKIGLFSHEIIDIL